MLLLEHLSELYKSNAQGGPCDTSFRSHHQIVAIGLGMLNTLLVAFATKHETKNMLALCNVEERDP